MNIAIIRAFMEGLWGVTAGDVSAGEKIYNKAQPPFLSLVFSVPRNVKQKENWNASICLHKCSKDVVSHSLGG